MYINTMNPNIRICFGKLKRIERSSKKLNTAMKLLEYKSIRT